MWLGILSLSLLGFSSHLVAQDFQCGKVKSYSDPCSISPKASTSYAKLQQYKSVSGYCGDGSSKFVSLQYCASKSILAMKLKSACIRAQLCGDNERPVTRLPEEPRIIVDVGPKPLPEPLPAVIPPEILPIAEPPQIPPPTLPIREVIVPKPMPEPLPPAPVVLQPEPPPQVPLPEPPPAIRPPPAPTGTFRTEMKATLSSIEPAQEYTAVTWTRSDLVSNYCGTGAIRIHYAKLKKIESAAFLAAYPQPAKQYMLFSLVCSGPPIETTSLVENQTGQQMKVSTYTYPDGCYVGSFTAASSPPQCMIP